MKTIVSFYVLLFTILNINPVISQTITISGYILNKNSGTRIKNASVFEAVEGIGTISNRDGYYKLLLNPGEKNFKVSDSGYETFIGKLDLISDTTFTVHLAPIEKENNNDSSHATGNTKKKNKLLLLF